MDHPNQILADQFKEAKTQFPTLQFESLETYTIEFKGPVKFIIKVTKNYPREKPTIFQDKFGTPLQLPIIQEWKPFYQLYHVVKHLKVFHSVKKFKPINEAIVLPEVSRIGLKASSLTDIDYYLNNVPSLESVKKSLPQAQKIIEDKSKSKKDAVEAAGEEILNTYNETKNLSQTYDELKRTIRVSKRSFFENEIARIDQEINDNERELSNIYATLMAQNNRMDTESDDTTPEIDLSAGKGRRDFIQTILKIQAKDAELRQRRNAIFSLNQKFIEGSS